jgi:hypothetical protein
MFYFYFYFYLDGGAVRVEDRSVPADGGAVSLVGLAVLANGGAVLGAGLGAFEICLYEIYIFVHRGRNEKQFFS